MWGAGTKDWREVLQQPQPDQSQLVGRSSVRPGWRGSVYQPIKVADTTAMVSCRLTYLIPDLFNYLIWPMVAVDRNVSKRQLVNLLRMPELAKWSHLATTRNWLKARYYLLYRQYLTSENYFLHCQRLGININLVVVKHTTMDSEANDYRGDIDWEKLYNKVVALMNRSEPYLPNTIIVAGNSHGDLDYIRARELRLDIVRAGIEARLIKQLRAGMKTNYYPYRNLHEGYTSVFFTSTNIEFLRVLIDYVSDPEAARDYRVHDLTRLGAPGVRRGEFGIPSYEFFELYESLHPDVWASHEYVTKVMSAALLTYDRTKIDRRYAYFAQRGLIATSFIEYIVPLVNTYHFSSVASITIPEIESVPRRQVATYDIRGRVIDVNVALAWDNLGQSKMSLKLLLYQTPAGTTFTAAGLMEFANEHQQYGVVLAYERLVQPEYRAVADYFFQFARPKSMSGKLELIFRYYYWQLAQLPVREFDNSLDMIVSNEEEIDEDKDMADLVPLYADFIEEWQSGRSMTPAERLAILPSDMGGGAPPATDDYYGNSYGDNDYNSYNNYTRAHLVSATIAPQDIPILIIVAPWKGAHISVWLERIKFTYTGFIYMGNGIFYLRAHTAATFSFLNILSMYEFIQQIEYDVQDLDWLRYQIANITSE